ncbi:MAG: Na+:solute symporter [Planctomycetota bacterium]|nr:Na+:solute symporter [Planctomycetota bacterium]
MKLHLVDWLVIGVYLATALVIGLVLSKRAGKSVDQFFLTGRSLPWWIAGTSMVATSFAADTPLLITGWVRDHGIWMNWAWWCYAATGMFGTFLFARWWRRGEVMTKAEVAELRYGGRGAVVLRGTLGVLHSAFTNVMILCWVMLAAVKIIAVLFDFPKEVGVALAATLAVSYSALSGIWGVVVTDLIQFAMALVGAFALAFLAYGAVGGQAGLAEAVAAGGSFTADTLRVLPVAGDGGVFDASFWTASITAFAVYLGVSWWAAESIDGSGVAVQRISATKDERHGMLAYLWFNILHYAVRPWPWIVVALASLVVLPHLEVRSPVAGTVTEVRPDLVVVQPEEGEAQRLPVTSEADDWRPEPKVQVDDTVKKDGLVARTDSEKAYVVMMTRYLPVGLLGLVIASLLAAFMSTIDTHVNLSSAFFVNDVYRRFLVPAASDKHYVRVARITSFVVLALACGLALSMDSIGKLFLFFLSFLAGVGPVYILRWLWWRVRATTELVAMVASCTTSLLITLVEFEWSLGSLSPDGVLSAPGRMIVVVVVSLLCALAATFLAGKPDPATLVAFYRKVRPAGWWGPVRALAGATAPRDPLAPVVVGIVGGLALIFGVLFATGDLILGSSGATVWKVLLGVAGAAAVGWSLGRTAPTGS